MYEVHIVDAIQHLYPDTMVSVPGNDLANLEWLDGNPKNITNKQIEDKYAELCAEEEAFDSPIGRLRFERNRLLAESDWTGLTDLALTNEKSAEWKLYRQKLRNITVGLDTVEKVNAVTWPEKPE
jgi:hypothetical protein